MTKSKVLLVILPLGVLAIAYVLVLKSSTLVAVNSAVLVFAGVGFAFYVTGAWDVSIHSSPMLFIPL